MGKPSSTQLSRKSDNSVRSNPKQGKMNVPLTSQKAVLLKKKHQHRTSSNIKKLFKKLRSQSDISLNTSQSSTILSLDDTPNDTIIAINDSVSTPDVNLKRKNSSLDENENKRKKTDESDLIIINDDDLETNSGPCQLITPKKKTSLSNCSTSTPIAKKDKMTLQDLILNSSKINNNSGSLPNLNEDIVNLTREINNDSYFTIDLTTESDLNKTSRTHDTVIDLANTLDTHDCTVQSVSNVSSMSGDSDVTVLHKIASESNKKEMKKIANGIAQLNSSEKGKLLEFITQKIFGGCSVPNTVKNSLANITESVTRATDTVEDTYIKEVILGETQSRNSIGSNIYHPERDNRNKTGLRMIVIDGSNVAMEHGMGKVFSVRGLKICIDYFRKRGHVVKAFVPRFRCKYGKSTEPRLLDFLERQGLVVYTPSREIKGRMITPYDDRYIVQCAAEFDGVIVSGDNYRDLLQENPRWRFIIENRVLPFTWVNDLIMFPRDPLGRNGPTLETYLKHNG